MRGRLYYTAKAKKKGKVMIKVHPCSRLCFCRCWACFKEVIGADIGGASQGLGHWGFRLRPQPWAVSQACILGPQTPFRAAPGSRSPFQHVLLNIW